MPGSLSINKAYSQGVASQKNETNYRIYNTIHQSQNNCSLRIYGKNQTTLRDYHTGKKNHELLDIEWSPAQRKCNENCCRYSWYFQMFQFISIFSCFARSMQWQFIFLDDKRPQNHTVQDGYNHSEWQNYNNYEWCGVVSSVREFVVKCFLPVWGTVSPFRQPKCIKVVKGAWILMAIIHTYNKNSVETKFGRHLTNCEREGNGHESFNCDHGQGMSRHWQGDICKEAGDLTKKGTKDSLNEKGSIPCYYYRDDTLYRHLGESCCGSFDVKWAENIARLVEGIHFFLYETAKTPRSLRSKQDERMSFGLLKNRRKNRSPMGTRVCCRKHYSKCK